MRNQASTVCAVLEALPGEAIAMDFLISVSCQKGTMAGEAT